jgi:hypothetical protein
MISNLLEAMDVLLKTGFGQQIAPELKYQRAGLL